MSSHLVVGATGGIGRASVLALLKREEKVRILVRNRRKAEQYFAGWPPLEIVEGDAAVAKDVSTAARGVKTLFYCVNVPYPRWRAEVRPLLATSVEAAARAGAKLVFPGNVYVYGHAQSVPVGEDHPFAAHTQKGQIRIQMEQHLVEAARTKGLRYTIVRMPDFYGPYVVNGFSEVLVGNALSGKTVRWLGDLDVPIEFIFVDDGGEAMVMVGLSDGSDGASFNVPGAGQTTARLFLSEMIRQAASSSRLTTLNSNRALAVAGWFNVMAAELKEMMYLKQEPFLLDGSLFRTTFGSLPCTPYPEGIRQTLDWRRAFRST
ncbi:MAG: NAD-dependent epimerase/dehydratase family protein [Acidobacteriota bacterium]